METKTFHNIQQTVLLYLAQVCSTEQALNPVKFQRLFRLVAFKLQIHLYCYFNEK